jgi:dolichyl-phosphate beta-glucosyltransferase
MTSKPELSIVVPIYDEARGLRATLSRLSSELDSLDLTYEIIGVDDGSRDDSGDQLIALAHSNPRLIAMRNPHNEGKGSAVQLGILAARGDWIATFDADLSTDPAVLPRALAALGNGAALVIGNRRLPESRVLVRQPVLRESLGRVFSILARVLVSGAPVDATCGFKAYRRDAAREVFGELETPGWAFDLEVIAIARQRDLPIEGVPVTWSHRRQTRVRLPGDGLRALLDLLRIAWNQRRGGYDA